jgi:hypothetical protein
MALSDNLTFYYAFEEASGNRADSTANALTLTDTNTVTQATGKVGNAAQFTAASSELLTRASEALLQTGDIDWTLAGWVYLDSKGANRVIVSKYTGSGAREYYLQFNNATDRFQLFVYDGTTQIGTQVASTFGAPSLSTWYFIRAWHSATSNQVGIQVNATAADTSATTGAGGTSTAALRFGDWIGTGINPWNGRMDEWGFWKRMLTSDEHTELYNAGNGRDYAYISAVAGQPMALRRSFLLTGARKIGRGF